MFFFLSMELNATILDKMDEKLRPPSPHFNDGKMVCFRCSASTSLNWGEGWFYFSFYSVQDCPRSTLALPEVMYTM